MDFWFSTWPKKVKRGKKKGMQTQPSCLNIYFLRFFALNALLSRTLLGDWGTIWGGREWRKRSVIEMPLHVTLVFRHNHQIKCVIKGMHNFQLTQLAFYSLQANCFFLFCKCRVSGSILKWLCMSFSSSLFHFLTFFLPPYLSHFLCFFLSFSLSFSLSLSLSLFNLTLSFSFSMIFFYENIQKI